MSHEKPTTVHTFFLDEGRGRLCCDYSCALLAPAERMGAACWIQTEPRSVVSDMKTNEEKRLML